jgi:DNA polymerase-1
VSVDEGEVVRDTAVAVVAPSRYERLVALAECERCGLCPSHDRTEVDAVTGYGSSAARIMVVGEAPGYHEVATHHPFTGPSGKLMIETLRQNGLKPTDFYLTNAVMCRPSEGRTAGPKDIDACRARLLAEIRGLRDLKVILAVGAKAVEALLGGERKITHENGRIYWSKALKVNVVCTYNPAFVLRRTQNYYDWLWAVRRAIALVEEPVEPIPPPPVPQRVVAHTVDEALEYLYPALDAVELSCDLETGSLNPRNESILDLGICYDLDKPSVLIPEPLLHDPAVHSILEILLTKSKKNPYKVIYHNGKFDVQWIRTHLGIRAWVGADTMVLHYLLDERSGKEGGFHDLKQLAHKYCDAPVWAAEVDEILELTGSMRNVPEDVRWQYHAYDCYYTLKLYYILMEELRLEQERFPSREDNPTLIECHDKLLMPAVNMLADAEMRGIAIDRTRLMELKGEYEIRIADLERKARAEAEPYTFRWRQRLNVGSALQVARILYDEMAEERDYEPTSNDKTQTKRSTNEEALLELAQQDIEAHRPPNPFLLTRIEYQGATHDRGIYIDGMLKHLDGDPAKHLGPNPDGCAHTNIGVTTTITGRLSSSGPNLQQIPGHSPIQEMFVARPGYLLFNADYKQLEIRMLALLSRDPVLTDDIKLLDMHWSTARTVFHRQVALLEAAIGDINALERVARSEPYFAEIVAKQLTAKRTDDPEELFSWLKDVIRRQQKFISFGIIYGRSAHAIAIQLKCPKEEAEQYRAAWFERYPVAAKYLALQRTLARTQKYVESPSGRHRRFPLWPTGSTPEDRKLANHLGNEAMNMPIQAGASDLDLLAMIEADRRFRKEEDAGRPFGHVLLPVHDAIIGEALIERIDEATLMIRDVMTTRLPDPLVTFEVDIKKGRTWSECH